jgi:hypothetical protein
LYEIGEVSIVSQFTEDTITWPRSSKGGVLGRPFVTDFRIYINGNWTVIFANATSPVNSPPPGSLVIGQIVPRVLANFFCAGPNNTNCHSYPNRVAVSISCVGDVNGTILSNDLGNTTCNALLTARDAIFEVTVDLNAFNDIYVGSWVHGNCTFQQRDSATRKVVFRVSGVETAAVVLPAVPNCCQCEPIANCSLDRAVGVSQSAAVILLFQPEGQSGAVEVQDILLSTKNVWNTALFTRVLVQADVDRDASRREKVGDKVIVLLFAAPRFAADGLVALVGSFSVFLPVATFRRVWPTLRSELDAAARLQLIQISASGVQTVIQAQIWQTDVQGTAGIVLQADGANFDGAEFHLHDQGETIATVTGPGGSTRPPTTPSPPGEEVNSAGLVANIAVALVAISLTVMAIMF